VRIWNQVRKVNSIRCGRKRWANRRDRIASGEAQGCGVVAAAGWGDTRTHFFFTG
jgi:hypothetical protein